MFSLIITIISIALVAVLALATLYYGGDAFNKGSADAQAAKVVNQGQQLLGAAEMFFVDNKAWPTNVQALIDGGYLKSAPVAYQGNGTVAQAWAAAQWEMPTAGQPVFVATLESNQACQAVNKRVIGEDVLLTQAFPNLVTQCYEGADDQLRAVVSKNAATMAAVAADTAQTLLPSADISATAYAAAGAPGGGGGAIVGGFVPAQASYTFTDATLSHVIVFTNNTDDPTYIDFASFTPTGGMFWDVTVLNTCSAEVPVGGTCQITVSTTGGTGSGAGELEVFHSSGSVIVPLLDNTNPT